MSTLTEHYFADNPIGELSCKSSVGTFDVFECQECYCLVHYSVRTAHSIWHDKLIERLIKLKGELK